MRTATVERVDVSAYEIPTESPESDGTLEWDSTTIVVAEVFADGVWGLGYTYGHSASAYLIADLLGPLIEGRDALDTPGNWRAMVRACRNLGRPGIASHAIAAVDTALWDLKARLLGVALVELFGAVREEAPLYGSGGFTSYDEDRLADQLAGWVEEGIPRVKMKVGREPEHDAERVTAARKAVGDRAELMVDANGAYTPKQALDLSTLFCGAGVTWFEEPVSSEDLGGLRFLRERVPAGLEVAAGEYAYDIWDIERILAAEAVDVLQIDATRCTGFTGFLEAAAVCEARHVPTSAHAAPQLHAHVACALQGLKHLEWFFDHVRVERLLFDGVLEPKNGALSPDRERPGMGLELKREDADSYAVWGHVDTGRTRGRKT